MPPVLGERVSMLELQNSVLKKTARERSERIIELERELQRIRTLPPDTDEYIRGLHRELEQARHPALDQACWDAFQKLDAPAGPSDIYVAGPFIGIGWGPPAHNPGQKISARWLGGAMAASIFVRGPPGLDWVIYVTRASPSEMERRLQVEVCGRRIEPRFSRDE